MNAGAAPSDDELAAIIAALSAAIPATGPVPNVPARSAWTLAARLPQLEIDDLRALRRAADVAVCSPRF